MDVKDVLAVVLDPVEDEAAIAMAESIVAASEARAAALIVSIQLGSSFAEPAALSRVLEDIAKGPKAAAAVVREKIAERLRGSAAKFELRDVVAESALWDRAVIAHAQLSDVVILRRATEAEHARRALAEAVLMQAGRPVLLTPPGWKREQSWERVVVAWNAKREAVRAVNDAMPFLKAAKKVSVVTIDALPTPSGHGQAPGRDLAASLAHRGVEVELRNVDGLGRSEARALLDEAIAVNAGMIVMGGYGHARAAEFVFGGVTRELMLSSLIPLLLSH